MTADFIEVGTLLLMLLNPLLIIIYLMDLVQELSFPRFVNVLVKAGLISICVFTLFAAAGNAIFVYLLQARFESFQIFGGIIFLIIGIRFVFAGPDALRSLRGETPENAAGSIAMPIMIGPGTVGASVLAGNRLGTAPAILMIVGVVVFSLIVILVLKYVHDVVKPRNEVLVQRYIEIAGRISALVIGTFSIEMIMSGLTSWARASQVLIP